jgi:peptidyl-prolyl cis-trans isomerase-like 4
MFGSQFFITLADNLDYLNGKHCIFGIVSEGFDTLDKLNESVVNEFNQPFRDIRYESMFVLYNFL